MAGDGDGSLFETQWPNATANPTLNSSVSPRKLTGNGGSYVERHLDTTVILYCDGHVKSVKLDGLADKRNNLLYLFTVQDD